MTSRKDALEALKELTQLATYSDDDEALAKCVDILRGYINYCNICNSSGIEQSYECNGKCALTKEPKLYGGSSGVIPHEEWIRTDAFKGMGDAVTREISIRVTPQYTNLDWMIGMGDVSAKSIIDTSPTTPPVSGDMPEENKYLDRLCFADSKLGMEAWVYFLDRADKHPEWLPIESAPKDDLMTRILAWNILWHSPLAVRYVEKKTDKGWRVWVDDAPLMEQPTHWMPLPPPKKESE